ncbi:MAG: zinc ribbon domain-containing protein [Thermoplasmata archaeon]|nr:MAG: zinc ribbon domain-containing protein [Thermoplasmata archaeon]
MPIYEYKCSKCGCAFEKLVFNSDQGEGLECPNCGNQETCRLMSSFSCGSSSGGGDLGVGASPSCGSSGGFS